MSTTVPPSSPTKVGVSVRSVPAPCGATRLPASAPATASTSRIGAKRAPSIVTPPSRSAKVMPWAPMLPGLGW